MPERSEREDYEKILDIYYEKRAGQKTARSLKKDSRKFSDGLMSSYGSD